jgi:hypothetical protein
MTMRPRSRLAFIDPSVWLESLRLLSVESGTPRDSVAGFRILPNPDHKVAVTDEH